VADRTVLVLSVRICCPGTGRTMRNRLTLILLLILMTVYGCAPTMLGSGNHERDTQNAFEASVERQLRLNSTAIAMQAAAMKLGCEDVTYKHGFGIFREDHFKTEYRDAALRYFKRENTISFVGQGSAAERAGLQPGDRLLMVNGLSTEKLSEDRLEKEMGKRTLALVIQKSDDSVRKVVLKAMSLCSCRVEMSSSAMLNAYKEGGKIVVTSGLVKFTKDDSELAAIIGHEIVHGIVASRKKPLSPQPLLTKDGSKKAPRPGSEINYLTACLLVTAGYNAEDGTGVWRRMLKIDSATVSKSYAVNHLSQENLAEIDSVIQSIREKQKLGRPLIAEKNPPNPM
jgi:hypothetical protein